MTMNKHFITSVVGCWLIGLCIPLALNAEESSAVENVIAGNSFRAMCNEVNKLGRTLSPESISRLYSFLGSKQSGALSRSELLALKDAVCTKLDHQTKYPSDLPERLMEMYADPAHDVAWRDYCIQHLNTGFQKASEEQRKEIIKTFWLATKEIDSTIAGTALIALNDHIADEGVDKDQVAAKALEIVLSETSGTSSKTTALQICAQLGEKKCLSAARDLAVSARGRTLRLSAIAAIGTLGESQDSVLLQKYASGTDRLVQVAAKSALKRLPENQ